MHPECQPQNAGGRHQENSCNVQFCTLKCGCPWPKSALDSHFRAIACFVVLYELYQIYQQQIAECDTALTAHLQTLDENPGADRRPAGNHEDVAVRQVLLGDNPVQESHVRDSSRTMPVL